MFALLMWLVNTYLGKANDAAGTATTGTVTGKLNKLLTDWTTARAGYVDNINTQIGATNNTGGSTTAGTIFAKLNVAVDYLVNALGTVSATGGTTTAGTANAKLNALLTNWTTARAGYLDTINTNIATTLVGPVNATGGTASAGSANAKLNNVQTLMGANNAAAGTTSLFARLEGMRSGVNAIAPARNRATSAAVTLTTADTNYTLLNISGRGRIMGINVSGSGTPTVSSLTIDGTALAPLSFNENGAFCRSSGGSTSATVGHIVGQRLNPTIRFNTSINIVIQNSAPSGVATVYYELEF